jgi:excisionase family DNA binding protein
MRTLLTVDQAAVRLGTSTRFIRRLVAERRIAYNKVGRYVRISEDDIDAFVASGRVEVRAHPASRRVSASTALRRRSV